MWPKLRKRLRGCQRFLLHVTLNTTSMVAVVSCRLCHRVSDLLWACVVISSACIFGAVSTAQELAEQRRMDRERLQKELSAKRASEDDQGLFLQFSLAGVPTQPPPKTCGRVVLLLAFWRVHSPPSPPSPLPRSRWSAEKEPQMLCRRSPAAGQRSGGYGRGPPPGTPPPPKVAGLCLAVGLCSKRYRAVLRHCCLGRADAKEVLPPAPRPLSHRRPPLPRPPPRRPPAPTPTPRPRPWPGRC